MIDIQELVKNGLKIHPTSPFQFPKQPRREQHSLEPVESFDGPESQLQKEAEQYLRARGLEYLHIRQCKGNKKGWPDLTILLQNGMVIFVELKVKGGKLSKEQKVFRQIALQSNHKCYEVRSIEQLISIIKTCGEQPCIAQNAEEIAGKSS